MKTLWLLRKPVLTVKRSWAELIARGVKKTENRVFRPKPDKWRGGLIIHAGKTDSPEGLAALREALGVEGPTLPAGHIVGVVAVSGYDRDTRTKWDIDGYWHWRLGAARLLANPFPAKGRLGIWQLAPEDIPLPGNLAALLEPDDGGGGG
jgi:hypothetical protein